MRRKWFLGTGFLLLIFLIGQAWSQEPDNSQRSNDERLLQSLASLESQVAKLNAEVTKLREDEAKLRAELELRKQNASSDPVTSQLVPPADNDAYAPLPVETSASNSPDPDPLPLDERVDLLEKKINEQYKTKVEAGSKYRVGFSGLVLLNLFANRGNVDSIEDPAFADEMDPATRTRGSIGGTLRQTVLGFNVNGPNVFGARASGNIQFDFAGGLVPTPGGETMGVMRLRTGTIRLDWDRTSLVAGQDGLFFAPLAPTSYASVLQPPLAYAGELWSWVPQVRVEQRLASNVTVKAGVLDPIDGQFPDVSTNNLSPGPGERRRMPGFGTHVGWSHAVFGRALSFGGGGYYGQQQFQISQTDNTPANNIVSWLGSADWEIPFSRWLVLSGSLYRGSALGGLGGGLGQSVVFRNFEQLPNPVTPPGGGVAGINTEGGWSQVKIQPFQKFEWNFAVGDDNPFASQLRSGVAPTYLSSQLSRNRAGFANFIYRPRSDLLLAWEFRHIETYPTQEERVSANQANMAVGIMF